MLNGAHNILYAIFHLNLKLLFLNTLSLQVFYFQIEIKIGCNL